MRVKTSVFFKPQEKLFGKLSGSRQAPVRNHFPIESIDVNGINGQGKEEARIFVPSSCHESTAGD